MVQDIVTLLAPATHAPSERTSPLAVPVVCSHSPEPTVGVTELASPVVATTPNTRSLVTLGTVTVMALPVPMSPVLMRMGSDWSTPVKLTARTTAFWALSTLLLSRICTTTLAVPTAGATRNHRLTSLLALLSQLGAIFAKATPL